MHGLNKAQYVDWIPVQGRVTNSTNQAAIGWEYALDDPRTLVELGVTLSNSQFEFYPYKAHLEIKLYNYASAPCYIQVIKLRARIDIDYPSTAFNEMATDAPAVNNPFVSITTGNNFQKKFKILSNTTSLVKPSHCKTIKCSKKYRASKMWTGRYEANQSYFYTRNNIVYVMRAWGMPLYGSESSIDVDRQQLSTLNVGGVVKRYFSWYAMDDSTPNSTLPGYLPLFKQNVYQPKFYTTSGQQQFDYGIYTQLPPALGPLVAAPSTPLGVFEFPVADRPNV